MQKTKDFLEALRLKTGARSYYHLSQIMEVDRSAVTRWRKGTTFDDVTAQRVAELLELHPGYVMACMNAERAQDESARTVWADVAEKLRTLGGVLGLLAAALSLFALVSGADQSALELVSSAAASDLTGIHIVQFLAVAAFLVSFVFVILSIVLARYAHGSRERAAT